MLKRRALQSVIYLQNFEQPTGFRDISVFIANNIAVKGTFLSESTNVFVITSNRRTFFFPETENLNFDDF